MHQDNNVEDPCQPTQIEVDLPISYSASTENNLIYDLLCDQN